MGDAGVHAARAAPRPVVGLRAVDRPVRARVLRVRARHRGARVPRRGVGRGDGAGACRRCVPRMAVPDGFEGWLQQLCEPEPEARLPARGRRGVRAPPAVPGVRSVRRSRGPRRRPPANAPTRPPRSCSSPSTTRTRRRSCRVRLDRPPAAADARRRGGAARPAAATNLARRRARAVRACAGSR